MKKLLLLTLFFSSVGCINSSLPTFSGTNSSLGSGNGQINISWDAVTGQQLGFKIEVSSNGIAYQTVTSTAEGVTSATVTNLVAGRQYFVRVRAYSESGDSVPSSPMVATAK